MLAVGFSSLKPIPNEFSELEKPDFVGKVALLTNLEK